MQHHRMRLQARYFEYVKRGTKRIELRLNDEKRALIRLDDIIEFINVDTGESILARVIGLLHYKSFEKLLGDLDVAIVADAKDSRGELLENLRKYYTQEEQREFGVLGIHIELL